MFLKPKSIFWLDKSRIVKSIVCFFLALGLYSEKEKITDCKNLVKTIKENIKENKGLNEIWEDHYNDKSKIKKISQDTFYDIFRNYKNEIYDFILNFNKFMDPDQKFLPGFETDLWSR